MIQSKICVYSFLAAVLISASTFAGEITGTITPGKQGIEVQINIEGRTYNAVTDDGGQFIMEVAERGVGELKIYYNNQWTEVFSITSREGTSRYDLSIETQCTYTLTRN